MEHSPEKHHSLARSKNCQITLAESVELDAFFNDETSFVCLHNQAFRNGDRLEISISQIGAEEPADASATFMHAESDNLQNRHEQICDTFAQYNYELRHANNDPLDSSAHFLIGDNELAIIFTANELHIQSHRINDWPEDFTPEDRHTSNLRTVCIGASLVYEALYPNTECEIELSPTSSDPIIDEPAPKHEYDAWTEFDKFSGMQAVGGLHEAKEHFGETIAAVLRPDLAKTFHLRPSHTLLYGPSGTGKSLLVQALAEELSAELTTIRTTDLSGRYVGDVSKNLKAIVQRAQDKYTSQVLFFDHIETLAHKQAHSEYRNAMKELSTILDNLSQQSPHVVIVAATTAMPDTLDSFLVRSGRLEPLAILPPDEMERREIWAIGIAEDSAPDTNQDTTPFLYADDVDVKKLAKLSDEFTGADCMTVLSRARRKAFLRAFQGQENNFVTQADLESEISGLYRN